MISNVLQYFRHSVTRFPNKDAVVCGGKSITYSELERTSSIVGAHINSLARQSTFIPFVVPKSIEAIQSILGILMSGRAYIPIDSNSPPERLKAILQVADVSVILVVDETEALVERAIEDLPIKVLNLSQLGEPRTSAADFDERISVDLAYSIFTSGSTGVPKGVMIPHKAIIDYIEWCVETYNITDSDVIANHAPLYFDNSTFDIYTAFHTGATLHLVPESLNAVLPRLVKWLNQSRITIFFCVPSVLTMLLKSRRLKADSFPELRRVLAAGEVLPPQVLRQWMITYPHIKFTNMYGPTEITVDCSFHNITEVPSLDCTSIPIGKARQNMEMYVLSENGSVTGVPGSKGELLVRGTSVAYGYLGDAKKTSQSFIQNPSHNLYVDRLYKTGDIVSIDENSDFHFIGRVDNQIKFLGYRIELGEIEAKLLTIDGVEEVVVVFGTDKTTAEKFIGSCLKLERDSSLEAVIAFMSEVLPSYMVPSVNVKLNDEFPRTPNAKYDRKAILRFVEDAS